MNYLLDTNVVSESIKKTPSRTVISFMQNIPAKSLYLSVLTIGEIRKGIERLDSNLARKQKLLLWLENDLNSFFADRILPINIAVADKWGFISAKTKSAIPAIDSLIAATALANNLILVTRNVSDFSSFKLELLNPWA